MGVCPFWLAGRCKFGDRCYNEHPARDQPGNARNSFAPLQGPATKGQQSTTESRMSQYKLDRAIIANDLGKERPLFVLSAYGPGRDAPLQLFGGLPREQSFEELRFRHYQLAAQGNVQAAMKEAQELLRNAEQQMSAALSDIDGAIRYICEGATQHPNRVDVCKARGRTTEQTHDNNTFNSRQIGTMAQPSAFGAGSGSVTIQGPMTNTFGKPSILPSSSTAGPSVPAFGQAATLGGPSSSAQPSAGFSQASNTISTTTFGLPSRFGAQQQAPTNVFNNPNPFVQVNQSMQASLADQSIGHSQNSVFGRPSFGGSASPFANATTTPISAPAVTAQANTSNNVDGPSTMDISGSLAGPGGNSANSFGSQGQNTQPMGTSAQGTLVNNTMANATAPRRPSINLTGGGQVQKDAQGKIRRWNGKDVQYIDGVPCFRESGHSEWQRIWFPDGPPHFTKTEDFPIAAYDEATKVNYLHLKEHGTFKDDVMPLLPPRREWCSWNL